jgi:hypothetical protein
MSAVANNTTKRDTKRNTSQLSLWDEPEVVVPEAPNAEPRVIRPTECPCCGETVLIPRTLRAFICVCLATWRLCESCHQCKCHCACQGRIAA